VEQLLLTSEHDDVIATLAARGVDRAAAAARVHEVLRSEGLSSLRQRLGEAMLAARLQRLSDELQRAGPDEPTQVVTCPDIDRDALLARHWIPSRPLRLTAAATSMRAVQHWSLRELGRRFGGVAVEVNVERTQASRSADVERRGRKLPLADFIERVQAEPGNDLYIVSRNGLLMHPELAPLWDDLAPLPEILEPPRRPRGASLWVGPAGTVTPPHFDPHNVLLVQVQGRKRVRLAPRIRAALHHELDGYYLRRSLDETFEAQAIATVMLEPGHALFVPVGWLHEVTALEPSITLSLLCFPWGNHFHFLGPPGAELA
jgi:hypothetical protein